MGRTRVNTSFGDTAPAPRLEFEKGQRGLHGSKPTCMDFGVGYKRKILHPSGYFCSNCYWYENEITAEEGRKSAVTATPLPASPIIMIGHIHVRHGLFQVTNSCLLRKYDKKKNGSRSKNVQILELHGNGSMKQ